MSERCRYCDRPKATREDGDRYRGGEGEHLCWGGQCPEVDWRARALAAEERLTMIQEGDRVDVLGGGTVFVVFGPESKRIAAVRTDRGDYVEVECAKCTVLPPAPPVEVKLGGEMRVVGVTVGGKRYVMLQRENPTTDPLTRYAALIADAETCVLDGPATDQAKCIAALAKALRESQAQCEEAKRTLRSIVEIVR